MLDETGNIWYVIYMKHQSGYVPVNFHALGIVLVILGVVGLVERIVKYFVEWNSLGTTFTYFTVVVILVGLYMLKYNPKEKK